MCNLRSRAPDDFPIVFVVVDGMDGLVLELVRSDLEIVRVGEPIELTRLYLQQLGEHLERTVRDLEGMRGRPVASVGVVPVGLTRHHPGRCRTYTPADLLPYCRAEGIPLVYDVHHHRCHRDGLTEDETTAQAVATWNREPLFHISSPIEGWKGRAPQRHHDFIDVRDFPDCWRDLDLTVEVEAKAKEVAVLKLKRELDEARRDARARMWFVYMLRCADGSLYTGIAKDVNRRCQRHNAGTASRYTRSRLPVRVAYQEVQATHGLALKREAAIKAMSRQQKELLIGQTPAD